MASEVATLAPGLLIAAPNLNDPNFDHSVVLLATHGEAGALGFVVNRASPVSVGQLLAHAGFGDELATRGGRPLLVGGPVQPSAAWTIWVADEDAPDPPPEGVLVLSGRIRAGSSRELFTQVAQELAAGDPRPRLVLHGYSGWGPGQLDGELAAGVWVPVALDEDLLFEPDLESMWQRAYERSGLSAVGGITMRERGEA
jgi:putative transcriptional regulator